ncbi:ABC transporter substrate-binding protein [Simiduia litorea]|uniref:heme/hemin ABC transporter substrate-binding protein n=1 Tax=Simiduia litorea TaxID=1435348 RepID=UPI0036F33EA8
MRLTTITSYFLLSLTPYLTLAADARIISTDATATELLLALNQGDNIIAVDVTSQLPVKYQSLPQVGYHRNLSAEGLLSLQPSLVVGSKHMGPAAVMHALTTAKIPIIQLTDARVPSQVIENIRTLAGVLNAKDAGESMVTELTKMLAVCQAQPLSTEKVGFILAMDPSKLRMAGTDTAGDALIQLLGANNVASYANYQTVSAEALLALAPTALIVASENPNDVNALLDAQPALALTPAGRSARIIHLNASALVAGLSPAAISEAARIHALLSR